MKLSLTQFTIIFIVKLVFIDTTNIKTNEKLEGKTLSHETSKIQVKNEYKINSRIKGKRSATDFFQSLLRDDNKTNFPIASNQTMAPNINYSSSSIPNSNLPYPIDIIINDDINSTPNTMPVISDWLKISSKNFKNTNKFPPIVLPDGQQLEITTDPFYFRINDGYKYNCHNNTSLPPTNKDFWFRLSGANIYYTLTKTDINILGAIAVRYIISVSKFQLEFNDRETCFAVKDFENQEWVLCAKTIEIRNKWVCQLQKFLQIQQDSVCSRRLMSNSPTNDITLVQPLVIIPVPSPHCNADWNYQQNGKDWQCDCSEGREQSPIDLPPKERAIDSPLKPLFQYEEVYYTNLFSSIEGQMEEKKVINLEYTENTLRIFHKYFGKVVTLDGAIYHAQEIVIHVPAEHKIDGRSFDMEVQVIHYGQTRGDIAKQVVLSFLFEKKAGIYNRFLDDLNYFNLPNPLTKKTELTNNIFIPRIFYSTDDISNPIMKPFSFYTYRGSLTNPPCTEKTIMYVASNPLPLSTTVLQMFQEALRPPDLVNQKGDVILSNLVPMSNREIQQLNDRPIFHYDHEKYCGPDPIIQAPRPQGHYEKIIEPLTKYLYVNDVNPSGIPGAHVISEDEAFGRELTKIVE